MNKSEHIERIFWSIAFPGFGQILNKQFLKGILFISSELVINTKANINLALIDSFYGDTNLAVKVTNYHWLMFYPCIYMFAIWDSYKNTGGNIPVYSFLPYVCSAVLGTLGVIYSPSVRILGFLLGPIWLPILCLITGMVVGFILRLIITKFFTTNIH